MRIKYRANGTVRDVRDSIAKSLIASGIATQVYMTRQMVAEEPPAAISSPKAKPRRKYKTRGMQAEA